MGLAGFGIALVAMAFLPWVMSPVTAVVLLTIYALVFSIVVVVPLRRGVTPPRLVGLPIGPVVGPPLGVWVLATLPISALNRLIGAVLVVVVALELFSAVPARLPGRGWGFGAGFLSGLVGGAVGAPGSPVILYAATHGWSRRPVQTTAHV